MRSVESAQALLRAGADKIAINTAATQDPDLIRTLARRFGSQCVVLSIEAKRQGDHWEAYCDNGRERTGLDVIEWSRRGEELGAGEILLTSVDCEGTRGGFDIELTCQVADAVSIPVIASGGMGNFKHLGNVVNKGHADAVAMAHVLHFDEMTVPDIRRQALAHGLNVRPV